jgi:SAM-dependent methyltransferase
MEEALYHTFAEIERVHWWCVSRRDILVDLAARLLPQGGRVLDLGCGTGFFIESLQARLGSSLEPWGLDPSPLALSICRNRGLRQVFPGSALDLGAVTGQTFDAIFLLDVLEHIDDDAATLQLLKPLLRPGGVIIATVPAFQFLWSKHDDISQHKRRYTRGSLSRAFGAAGISLEKLTYFNALLFPLAWARRVGRRWLGTDDGVEFDVPAAPLNALLRWVFRAETPLVLAAGQRGTFPVGLSLLAVGRPG